MVQIVYLELYDIAMVLSKFQVYVKYNISFQNIKKGDSVKQIFKGIRLMRFSRAGVVLSHKPRGFTALSDGAR
jgi:hypothetical protein